MKTLLCFAVLMLTCASVSRSQQAPPPKKPLPKCQYCAPNMPGVPCPSIPVNDPCTN